MFEEVTKENEKLRKENQTLLTDLEKARAEKKKYRDRSNRFRNAILRLKSGAVPKKTAEIVVQNVLHDKVSQAQLNNWLKDRKTSKSSQWSEDDFANSAEIGAISRQALNKTRALIPLPGYSTVQQRFSFLSIEPG